MRIVEDAPDARGGYSTVVARVGVSNTGPTITFRSATSCCAVTTTFSHAGTRGTHPRCSCAALRPARTQNSKELTPSGRLTTEALPSQGFGEGSDRGGRGSRKQDTRVYRFIGCAVGGPSRLARR